MEDLSFEKLPLDYLRSAAEQSSDLSFEKFPLDDNVHSWTSFFQNYILNKKNQIENTCSEESWNNLCSEINDFIHENEHAKCVLEKMKNDYQSEWKDPDLFHIHVSDIFLWVWTLLKTHQSQNLIVETLVDIGDTCIQGITHRLLSLAILFEH